MLYMICMIWCKRMVLVAQMRSWNWNIQLYHVCNVSWKWSGCYCQGWWAGFWVIAWVVCRSSDRTRIFFRKLCCNIRENGATLPKNLLILGVILSTKFGVGKDHISSTICKWNGWDKDMFVDCVTPSCQSFNLQVHCYTFPCLIRDAFL